MQIIRTDSISEKQKLEIEALLQECRSSEGLRLSFPFEEVNSVYLLLDRAASGREETLISVLGLILPRNPESGEPAECCAFTLPSRRRQGCFSALLEAASEELDACEVLFLADHTSPGALSALEALGAELEAEEYRMELSLEDPALSSRGNTAPPRLLLRQTEEGPGTILYEFFLREQALSSSRPVSGEPSEPLPLRAAAICRTKSFGSRACFYDFSVREELRGAGLGEEALRLVLDALQKSKLSGVFLHVSGSSLPAVSLYQKTGFHISETLSFYLY